MLEKLIAGIAAWIIGVISSMGYGGVGDCGCALPASWWPTSRACSGILSSMRFPPRWAFYFPAPWWRLAFRAFGSQGGISGSCCWSRRSSCPVRWPSSRLSRSSIKLAGWVPGCPWSSHPSLPTRTILSCCDSSSWRCHVNWMRRLW